ncbi:MAG TPA: HNH endonuclease [Chloroflexi bacterium]|nr:HNH endonuclease [Chloroflexota bacterium]
MPRDRISPTQRQRIATAAHNRCAYCHTPERIIGPFLEIDHIIPQSAGGATNDHNLTLACPLCNSHKSDRTHAIDPATGETAPLFHPNEQRWHEHFAWSEAGAVLIGKTPTGRATVAALDMNHPDVVATRRLWITVGWHPPAEDQPA